MPIKNSDTCRACGYAARFQFNGRVLGRSIRYFDCERCGYLQTESPHWLDEAYASPINATDTGIVERNILNARRVGAVCLLLGKSKARIVDFAGGHGLLVRMLRDQGLDALWSDKFCENLFARGFEHSGQAADLATAFEAFEHFVEPAAELDRMLDVAPVVLFSTLLLPEPVPRPGSWWYYGEEHGQHVGFFRRGALEQMAKERSARFFSNGTDLHAITRGKSSINFRLLQWAMRAWPFFRRVHLRQLTLADHEIMKTRIESISTEIRSE